MYYCDPKIKKGEKGEVCPTCSTQEKCKEQFENFGLSRCPKCGSFTFPEERFFNEKGEFEKCYFCDVANNGIVIKM